MRIAMLSYHTCPLATLGGKDTGGMNVYVRDLTRELGRHGVGVDVFTRSQDEHVPHVLHDLGYGNRIVHIPAGPEIPLEKSELVNHINTFVENIEKFVDSKQLSYDLLHAHYWLSGLAGLELRDRWGIPLVQMFHTLALMKNRVASAEGDAEPDVRVEGERKLLREADRIVAATQAELAQIQWLYQTSTDRVVVIPPGVDTAHFYPIAKDEAREFISMDADTRMILYVGRIETLKGIDMLIKAMTMLQEEGFLETHPICVAIIGGEAGVSEEKMSAEMARLQALRLEAGLDDIVHFLGKRDQDTLQYYYSAAEIVVVPSHYESFGLVALEAMACGTPVVASETGGLAFLVRDGETGYHVPTGNVEALAARIKELLTDEVLRARMGKTAAAYACQYDWSVISEQVLDLYAALIPKLA
ncbi:MAG: glycosyltransferase [Anaerolineales bacterium]|nr:glycosyltransferase [Anaerolineales bacterium]